MSKNSARQKQCLNFQEKMAKKREQEFWHQEKWDNQVQYYQKYERVNTKFDEWTSPRYYESNNELVERVKKQKEKTERLGERREKLKRMLEEEDASYEIEIMMKKAKAEGEKQYTKFEDIPTELLEDVNVGLKLEEDQKKRREAELQLYHQWRNDNPSIRDAERCKTTKNLKLSWLDQQIEKRMAKEKEQEECRKILKERDRNIEEQKKKEQIISEEVQKKNRELQDYLVKQMEEINLKMKIGEELQEEEREEFEKQRKIAEFQEKMELEEARRKSKEVALYNMKHHNIKMKRMAKEVEENLEKENELVRQILASQAAERIRNEATKRDVSKTLEEFLEHNRQQKLLEKRRQEHLDFVFDSEAKLMYEKQKEVWDREARARDILIKDVLDTIGDQIRGNLKKNKENQKELLEEREKMLVEVERCEKELEDIRRLEKEKKGAVKKELQSQIADKKAKKTRLKELEKKNTDIELEKIRKEEERLNREIMRIQKSHAPMRYARKKSWH